VRNSSGGGVEDYAFTYGNPGDTILVGDWADPANGKSGNGADQIAVRRDGNHYFFSKELGKGADIGTAMRDQLYGEATDTVFAAALPSVELDKDGKPYPNNQRPKTYAADTGAVYAGGETVLNTDTGAVVLDQVSSKPLTYKAGDPKLRIKGEKQVYRGGEVKLGVNGKPVVYVANGTVTTDPNEQALPSADGKVPLYLSGEVRLNADGSQKRTITAGSSTVDVWDGTEISDLPAAQREYTAKVGDPVLRRAGEQMVQSPLVQKTWTAADDVVLNESTDVILNPDGTPALNAGAYQYHNGQVTKKEADGVTVVKHKDGDPVTRRAGEIVKGYQWSGTAWTGPTAIPNDEATGWYLTRNPGTTAPTADNKKVADLDNDLDVEPVWYKGTEPIFGDGTTSLPNYLGGEAVAGNKAGDVVRDKDGNVIMVNTSIKGDGLGVRRNFG